VLCSALIKLLTLEDTTDHTIKEDNPQPQSDPKIGRTPIT